VHEASPFTSQSTFVLMLHEPVQLALQRASHIALGGVPLHWALHSPLQLALQFAAQVVLSPCVAQYESQFPPHLPVQSAEQSKLPGFAVQPPVHEASQSALQLGSVAVHIAESLP
jgi:hypothetical protein